MSEEGSHGEGGGTEPISSKTRDRRLQNDTRHKQEGFQGKVRFRDKGKGESVERRNRPVSNGTDTEGKN